MNKGSQVQESTAAEIDQAVENAYIAFNEHRTIFNEHKAAFLQRIAELIETDRNALAATASAETSLPVERLRSEISRTIFQCKFFADLLNEGSWIRAIIDTADPDRKPLPKPDIRQMQQPLGPVAVFGASNFPFAYSVCGGDTVAAFAAGCPVIYKANPGHPETSVLVANIVTQAAKDTSMPDSSFSMVQGAGNETGIRLVMHPHIKAVGFTGSFGGGRALFDAATKREEPIPVYAEMGSTNPVFILPEMLEQKNADMAKALAASNTASAGQFCTNPGIMVTGDSLQAKKFHDQFAEIIRQTPSAHMLTPGIFSSFEKSMSKVKDKKNVSLLAVANDQKKDAASAHAFLSSATDFLNDKELWEEMFGPSSIQVTAKDNREMIRIAKALPGQITVSVWGTENDLKNNMELISLLEQKAGRIIINGVPTGVEVVAAMNHGGPYPATTDSKFTSVGTQSIYRFTRAVCYQNYPQYLLPPELQDQNPIKIWRLVNNAFTKNQAGL